MRYFDVFEHPVRGIEAIKHGFSWPALFWGVLWVLFHQLWLPALLLVALIIIAAAIGVTFDSPLEGSVLGLAVWVFAGFHGNDWRRSDLSKRGFTYIGTYQADTP